MPKLSIKHDYKHTQQKRTSKKSKLLKLTTLLPITILLTIIIAIPYWQKHKEKKHPIKTLSHQIQISTSDLQISG
jgi:hypothetical protein